MYEYKARVINVVDGDTIDVAIDLGFRIMHEMRVRILGVDTPEKNSSNELERRAAKYVTEYAKAKLDGKFVYLRTEKPTGDKYGRFLASVYFGDFEKESYNDKLLKQGLAMPYEGGKKTEWTQDQLAGICYLLGHTYGYQI